MMDADVFTTVGEIAGIGGIALLVLLFVFRAIIRKNIFPQLGKTQAYRLLRLITVLVSLVALAGLGVGSLIKPRGDDRGGIGPVNFAGIIFGDVTLLQTLSNKQSASVFEKALPGQLREWPSKNPDVQHSLVKAADAVETGNFDKAEKHVSEARIAARAEQQHLQAALRKQDLEQARIEAFAGELRWAQLKYRAAAEHFRDAADLVPEGETRVRADYLELRAEALRRHGLRRGSSRVLQQAVEAYDEAVQLRMSAGSSLQMLLTRANASNAKLDLAEWAGWDQRQLRDAIEGYREIMAEDAWKRASSLERAVIEGNLSYALVQLARVSSEPGLLHEALDHIEEARDLADQGDTPWLRTKLLIKYAFALGTLAEALPDGPASAKRYLEQTLEFYQQALDASRADSSDEYTLHTLRNNVAYTRARLASLSTEPDTEVPELLTAADDLKEVLDELDIRDDGGLRPDVLHSLGFTLGVLGAASQSPACLEAAVYFLEQARFELQARKSSADVIVRLEKDLATVASHLDHWPVKNAQGTGQVPPVCRI